MFNLLRLKFVFVLLFSVLITPAFSEEKNITYLEILENPNDLDLNLTYAKQQGELGNFKQTIATLERLNIVYPDNVWYSCKTEEEVDQVINEHLINDRIAENLQIKK